MNRLLWYYSILKFYIKVKTKSGTQHVMYRPIINFVLRPGWFFRIALGCRTEKFTYGFEIGVDAKKTIKSVWFLFKITSKTRSINIRSNGDLVLTSSYDQLEAKMPIFFPNEFKILTKFNRHNLKIILKHIFAS